MKTAKKAALILATAGLAAGSAAGAAFADAGAEGLATGSPGVLSGNALQVPVHVPTTVCGNTIDAIGLLNPAFGNLCANG